jgi:methionyl-tRNA formyltransferase
VYWAWRLADEFPPRAIVVEQPAPAPYDTSHPFEAEREAYERATLLAGGPAALAEVAPTIGCERTEDELPRIAELRPDVVLVFGTRLLGPRVIAVAPAALNLHGGNPEHYRGLDTHLWAIWHRDFANVVTTLHRLDEGLDTGAIVFQQELRLERGMALHELRAVNARACAELSLLALRSLDGTGDVPARTQVALGRYYGAMPAVLKERCVEVFDRHTAAL